MSFLHPEKLGPRVPWPGCHRRCRHQFRMCDSHSQVPGQILHRVAESSFRDEQAGKLPQGSPGASCQQL